MRIETPDDKEYSYYDDVLKKVAVSDYVNNPIYKKRLYASFIQSCHDEMGDDISELIYGIIDKYRLCSDGVLSEPMEQLQEIFIHHISKNQIFMKDYVNRHPECIRELLDQRVMEKKTKEFEKEKERMKQIEYQKQQYILLKKNKEDYNSDDVDKIKSFDSVNDYSMDNKDTKETNDDDTDYEIV